MPRPSFTAAEQLMVGRILEPSESSLVFEVAYLVPAAVLVLIGFAYDAPAAFASAFALILAFRFWQVSSDRRGLPVLREVIRKYEQACDASPDAGSAGHPPSTATTTTSGPA
jgi:hypothetical protein